MNPLPPTKPVPELQQILLASVTTIILIGFTIFFVVVINRAWDNEQLNTAEIVRLRQENLANEHLIKKLLAERNVTNVWLKP
jgi:hypothetical protein